ncbi:MAG TPA: hypothetical protein VF659_14480 [Pyrinomonadaceae bacterium]|jgi:hypothetical protein
MKEGFDKEIDSLLRRRARGAAHSLAGGGAQAAAPSHLDADELGAFAEGALPAPARLAAASHLADCDRCRGVVVELSRALGGAEVKQNAAAVPASVAAERPAGWRAWAAALFAPRVLRYAAPALALSLVAVVSYVALRSRSAGSLQDARSARTTQTESAKPLSEPATTATTGMANSNTDGLVAQNPEVSASPDPETAGAAPRQPTVERGHGNAGEAAPVVVEGPTVAADAPVPPPPPAASAAAAPEMAKLAPRPAAVDEPEQPSKSESRDKEKGGREAEPAGEVASNDLSGQQRNRAQSRAANEVQMPDGGSRNQKRAADDNRASNNVYGSTGTAAAPKESEREDRSAGAGAARRARPATRAEQSADTDEVARVGETRAAAGHRFRREGSAWVDVNYKSSMPSTGVRRGTEAFRALVADVPEVGRVAAQLGGEVVVVVRGRAYRIR